MSLALEKNCLQFRVICDSRATSCLYAPYGFGADRSVGGGIRMSWNSTARPVGKSFELSDSSHLRHIGM